MRSLNKSLKQKTDGTKTINKPVKKLQLQFLNNICDIDTLRTLIKKNKVRIVDVRKKEDYLKGHIKTAVSLPLAELLTNDDPESVIIILNRLGISENTPVVIYDDTFGALASRVAWSFKFVGHENVALLEV